MCSLSDRRMEKRGWACVIGAFAICPCHSLLRCRSRAVLSGTAAGAAIAGPSIVAGVAVTTAWLAANVAWGSLSPIGPPQRELTVMPRCEKDRRQSLLAISIQAGYYGTVALLALSACLLVIVHGWIPPARRSGAGGAAAVRIESLTHEVTTTPERGMEKHSVERTRRLRFNSHPRKDLGGRRAFF